MNFWMWRISFCLFFFSIVRLWTRIEMWIFLEFNWTKKNWIRFGGAHTMLIVTRLIYKWQKTAKWFGLWYQSSDIKCYRYTTTTTRTTKKCVPFLVVTREKRRRFYPTALTLPSHLYFLYGCRVRPLLHEVSGVYACWPFVVAA